MEKGIKETFSPIIEGFKLYKESIKDLGEYKLAKDEQPFEDSQKGLVLDSFRKVLTSIVETQQVKKEKIFGLIEDGLNYIEKETGVKFTTNDKHIINVEGFTHYQEVSNRNFMMVKAAEEQIAQIKKAMAVAPESQKGQLKQQLDAAKKIIEELNGVEH